MDIMFWKIRSCKHISVAVLLHVTLITFGCVPVPYLPSEGQLANETEARLVVGTTTKAQVLELHGKPDLLEQGRFLLYRVNQHSGGLILLGLAPQGVFGWPVFHDEQDYRVLLEFDNHDVLKRFDIEVLNITSSLIHLGAEGLNPAFEQEAIRRAFQTRTVLFKEDFHALGFAFPIGFNWVAFSKDGRLVVARDTVRGRIWLKHLDTGRRITLEPDLVGTTNAVVFSPDGTKLAFVDSFRKRTVRIIDVGTGAVTTSYKGHGQSYFWTVEGPLSAAFHPKNSLIATAGIKGYVKIWDRDTGEETLSFKAHDHPVSSLAYSSDGRWLVTADDYGKTKIWDATTGRGLGAPPGRRQPNSTQRVVVKFSPDGQLVAVNTSEYVTLWRIGPGANSETLSIDLIDVVLLPYLTPCATCVSYGAAFLQLDFSPDGRLVAAGNGSTVIYDISNAEKLWRVGREEPPLKYSPDVVSGLAFSPDGKGLATATPSGVYLWQ